MEQVTDVLSQNVAAALYREAMEGNVSAQVFWLKTLPPPGWQRSTEDPIPRTFDETLEQLTDEELFELARSMGVHQPPENSGSHKKTSDKKIPPSIP
ncbi:hypothetical protein MNBD_PLANCTO02-3034 [hydrothermal vent metagenome]|uniref:Uncharacterized protein n=1 Tax=hydrothermal vent metagenome TaxID=652676 RepID=A0A3B1DFT6_9ZZZZ